MVRPCHALEPLFDHVAADFQASHDVLFLAANCDEDESLVGPYVEGHKPRTAVVFADGLDRFFTSTLSRQLWSSTAPAKLPIAPMVFRTRIV